MSAWRQRRAKQTKLKIRSRGYGPKLSVQFLMGIEKHWGESRRRLMRSPSMLAFLSPEGRPQSWTGTTPKSGYGWFYTESRLEAQAINCFFVSTINHFS
jgi:hypothetical protein